MRRLALSVCLAAMLAAPAAKACETALVLAIDVSGSVDPEEYRLQMDGLAAALRDPTVRDALIAAEARVSVMQWSGSSRQHVVAPWAATLNDDDIEALARTVETAPRAFRHFSTAIGEALRTAAALLGEIAGTCARQVVDVSGDGFSNEGVEAARMRDALIRGGVTVNGLAIGGNDEDVLGYYGREVIRGPGAFVMSARNHADFRRAMEMKLIREISPPQMAAVR